MKRIETLFLGKDLRFYKELESTNKMLKTLLREEKCSEGLVVKADFQTAGRGQRNSEWISPAGEAERNMQWQSILLVTDSHYASSSSTRYVIVRW